MKYTPLYPVDVRNINEACKNADKNFKTLRDIDQESKRQGILQYRYIDRQVADGKVFYQITRVSKKLVDIELCDGICLDNYIDDMFGKKCTLQRDVIERLVKGRDELEKLFGHE